MEMAVPWRVEQRVVNGHCKYLAMPLWVIENTVKDTAFRYDNVRGSA